MIKEFIFTILEQSWHILREPWLQRESLWIILPLIIILVLMHLYFGRYRSEELGWNSSFGNSISLLWISVILSNFLFSKFSFQELYFGEQFGRLIVLGILVLWVLIILIFNFFHVLPKKFSFIISSAGSVYIFAYVVISLIFGNFVFNKEIVISSLLAFLVLLLLVQTIKHLVPMTRNAKQVLEIRKEKKIRKKAGKKAAKTKKWKALHEKISRWKNSLFSSK